MAEINLEEVVYDSDIYPREKWSTHTIGVYADALKGGAKFPPIILEEGTNKILDGVHRWKAHQQYLQEYREYKQQPQLFGEDGWQPASETIEVEWQKVPDGIPVKLYAASLSAKHGDRLTSAEVKSLAREIYTLNPDFILEVLCEYLPVSKSRAGEHVADLRAKRKEQQKMVAYRLHRLGWTQDEIAERVGVGRITVRDFLAEFPGMEKEPKKLLDSGIPHLDVAERYNMPLTLVWAIDLAGKTDATRMEKLGISIQPYDVWHFSKCHDLFGNQHPGRIPGDLIAHVLYFYTEPGATIIDPMAGSGTTLDVCLAMGRECYAYDIDDRHGRPDIIKHNLTDGWPERTKKADLIFWDPPYYKKMDSRTIGDEGYIDESISKLDRSGYIHFFMNHLQEAHKMVKKGTKLAFLMSDWDGEHWEGKDGEGDSIFIWDYAYAIINAGWKPLRHIQVPLSTQQVHPDIVVKFRKSRRLARLERYLIIAEA